MGPTKNDVKHFVSDSMSDSMSMTQTTSMAPRACHLPLYITMMNPTFHQKNLSSRLLPLLPRERKTHQEKKSHARKKETIEAHVKTVRSIFLYMLCKPVSPKFQNYSSPKEEVVRKTTTTNIYAK